MKNEASWRPVRTAGPGWADAGGPGAKRARHPRVLVTRVGGVASRARLRHADRPWTRPGRRRGPQPRSFKSRSGYTRRCRPRCAHARVAKLADAPDLGSGWSRKGPWGFDSPLSHHRRGPPARRRPQMGVCSSVGTGRGRERCRCRNDPPARGVGVSPRPTRPSASPAARPGPRRPGPPGRSPSTPPAHRSVWRRGTRRRSSRPRRPGRRTLPREPASAADPDGSGADGWGGTWNRGSSGTRGSSSSASTAPTARRSGSEGPRTSAAPRRVGVPSGPDVEPSAGRLAGRPQQASGHTTSTRRRVIRPGSLGSGVRIQA